MHWYSETGYRRSCPARRTSPWSLKQFYYVIRVEDPDRGPWKVSTAEYTYNLRDTDNRVVLAFQQKWYI